MSHSKFLFCGILLAVFFISNTLAQDSWSKGTNMPTPRSAHVVGSANGKIYVVGGNEPFFNSTEEYDPETDIWTQKANNPSGRGDFSGCGMNGKIYAIGGWINNFTLYNIEEYDPATNTWTSKSAMPSARWGHATSHVDGKIYVIGGADGWPVERIHETIEIFNPGTNTWTSKENMQTPRWFPSSSVVNGIIYVIGGHDDQEALSTVEAYDPVSDTWTTKSPMPTARWGLATATVNGKIYAFGGGDAYPINKVLKTVEEYDPTTDTWTTKSPMPAGRAAFAACSVNGKIYIPGGGGVLATDRYAEVYIYDPGTTSSSDNNIIIPENFLLLQNYPNPFQHFTTIRYSAPKSDFVTIKIYNLVGREVETLVNSFQLAGDNQISWQAEGFQSGIYYYRLQTGEFSESRKLILQK